MKRGPTPKPTALRVLEGNPGRRPIRPEPHPRRTPPEPPEWLVGRARAVWDELADELARLGLLTVVDGPAFAMLCVHAAMSAQAAEILAAAGADMTSDPRGRTAKHPAAQILRDQSAAFRQYAAEFGLTPSARSRLASPLEASHDDDPYLDG